MINHFAQNWLNTLCQIVPGIKAAAFMIPNEGEKTLRALAKWPADFGDFSDFESIVNFTLAKNQHICLPKVKLADNSYYDFFALPLTIQTELIGILAVKTDHQPTGGQESVINNLQNSTRWLELAFDGGQFHTGFYANVTALLAVCYEQKSYREMLIALTAGLTRILGVGQVAIGEFTHLHSKVIALSNSAGFDERANIMQKLADAMDEAIEQDCIVSFPNTQSGPVHRAHKELSQQLSFAHLFTVPMVYGANQVGAVTVIGNEGTGIVVEQMKLCEQVAALVTPVLRLKKADEQALPAKFLNSFKKNLTNTFGFAHLKTKLLVLSSAVFLLLSSLIPGDFRLTADAVLEGKIQRVVAAPISGFLMSSSVRAGDNVRQGEIMATLDDADLKLELSKLTGQIQKYRRAYREALSAGDLVKVRVISAQIDQAAAEIDLNRQQLQKVALAAPFDSVVIEGDLSQKLGSPVERGETLFKIAPLLGYRIILKVGERDISYVQENQKGTLTLASMPDKSFPLTVEKITAVAKVDNGENIFRVQANLDNPPNLLRPGMEGIGKISAGKASLLWIWTHELRDWLRLWFWSWQF